MKIVCAVKSRSAVFRTQEDEETRESQLSADRERHALSRASETYTQREDRLSSLRIHSAVLRSQEDEETRKSRLSADRERHALSRASDTYTQREDRLSSLRIHSAVSRSQRLRFPISVCFAMTVNKSQGQTLRAAGAGVDLRTSCFWHGQLYVACSRVTSCDQLCVLKPAGETHNVVYKEVLTNST